MLQLTMSRTACSMPCSVADRIVLLPPCRGTFQNCFLVFVFFSQGKWSEDAFEPMESLLPSCSRGFSFDCEL